MPPHKMRTRKKKKKAPARSMKATSKKPKKPLTKKASKKPARKKTTRRSKGKRPESELMVARKGPGPGRAGQSGDVQGLEQDESVDTESVEELAEEGQGFEAAFVEGVENAPDPDEAEVTTSETSEEDVPSEYLDNE